MRICGTCGQAIMSIRCDCEQAFSPSLTDPLRASSPQPIRCRKCGGHGTVPTPMGYEKCYACGGTGWQR